MLRDSNQLNTMPCDNNMQLPYMSMLLYAPVGGLVADLLEQPVSYGMVAGAALAYFMPGSLPLRGRLLFIAAGASLGYLYLSEQFDSDAMGAAVGAALGFVAHMLLAKAGGSGKSYSNSFYSDPALVAAQSSAVSASMASTGGTFL